MEVRTPCRANPQQLEDKNSLLSWHSDCLHPRIFVSSKTVLTRRIGFPIFSFLTTRTGGWPVQLLLKLLNGSAFYSSRLIFEKKNAEILYGRRQVLAASLDPMPLNTQESNAAGKKSFCIIFSMSVCSHPLYSQQLIHEFGSYPAGDIAGTSLLNVSGVKLRSGDFEMTSTNLKVETQTTSTLTVMPTPLPLVSCNLGQTEIETTNASIPVDTMR